jgi:hypothetical protein
MGGDEMEKDEYFLVRGQAYVRSKESGDVVAGPFSKGTAAYKRAAGDSMSGRTVDAGTRSMLQGMIRFMRGGGGPLLRGK